jgi:EAL domain-containing protein (putative c-di-GMP-specific phosphodiesterase class I)
VPNTALRTRSDFERHLFPDAEGNLFANYGDLVLSSVFQPIVDAQRRLRAYEALLRTATLKGTLIQPQALFQAAARSAAEGIDQVNLDRIASIIHLRNYARYRLPYPLHLNVLVASACDGFVERDSGAALARRLSNLGLVPGKVVYEISAEFAPEEPRLVRAARQLRSNGIRYALEDYRGSAGAQALARRLAPNVIKIDRELLQAHMAGKGAPLREALDLARETKAVTVALGIETPQQFAAMVDAGVDLFQGYYLGHPEALAVFHGRSLQPAYAPAIEAPEEVLVP